MVQKVYSKMYPVSSTNTYHDITYLVNQWMVKNTKTFYKAKKFLTCASDETFWEVIVL